MKKLSALFLYATFCLGLKAQVSLGPTVSTFGVLAGSTVTNSGFTTVVGDLGVSPGSAVTGFTEIAPSGPGSVTGTIHAADAVAAQAQSELTAAYNTAAGLAPLPPIIAVPADIGGTTVTPGVHAFGTSLGITGTVTLDAGGNPNAIFVFQIGSTLTTATSSNVSLIGLASPANVYWQVGSSATLGTTSSISGNIMAQSSISFGTGAVLNGRALARTGAVTLLGNSVVSPGGPGTPPPSSVPAPSSLMLVATALLCAALYQGRGWLLKPFRSN